MDIAFIAKEKQHSEYDWADISDAGERVGKARCRINGLRITIYSINIYPEKAGLGYGKGFVDYCKQHFRVLIADRVRPTAIGFWNKMGFCDNNDGSWGFFPPGGPFF
jgi:hypothetical protein